VDIIWGDNMKKVICVLFVFCIFVTFSGCYSPLDLEKRPDSQPNTKWVSENGSIEFYVQEDGKCIGTIIVNGEPIDVLFVFGIKTTLYIYPLDALDEETNVLDGDSMLEHWMCSYKSKDKFVVTTTSKSTYFRGDQKIVFRKTGDG